MKMGNFWTEITLHQKSNVFHGDSISYWMCHSSCVVLVVQVSVLDGALDCWVFLSCLEVLHRIEGCCDQVQLAANCSHTVGLWAYATDKVTKSTESCSFVFDHLCNFQDVSWYREWTRTPFYTCPLLWRRWFKVNLELLLEQEVLNCS